MDKEQWVKFGDWLAVVLLMLGGLQLGFSVLKINLIGIIFSSFIIGLFDLLVGVSVIWIFIRAVILKDFMEGRY